MTIRDTFGASASTGLTMVKLNEAIRRLWPERPQLLVVSPQGAADLANQAQPMYFPRWSEGHLVEILGIPVRIEDTDWHSDYVRYAYLRSASGNVAIACADLRPPPER